MISSWLKPLFSAPRTCRRTSCGRFSADSIDAVAAASGFGNRFYFSRVFARHLGVAPGAYRRMARV